MSGVIALKIRVLMSYSLFKYVRTNPKPLFITLFTIISGGLKRDINVEPSTLSDQFLKQPNHQFS